MMEEEKNQNHTTSRDGLIYPDLTEYYSNLNPFIVASLFIAGIVLILNIAIFSATVVKAVRSLTNNLLIPTVFLCSIYPLISVAAVVTILLPKSWFICHTVMHLSFTIGAVIFHKLCYRYVTSEEVFIKEVDGNYEAMDLQTPPCCCCCACLPKFLPTKTKLCIVKYLIWQMPFVQSTIMIVLNVMYYNHSDLYENTSMYFIPFIVVSIMTGLWGLNITVRMINKSLPDYNLMKKMLCLQLILLLCKLQYLVLESQLDSLDFGGVFPITNTIYKQTIINLLIAVEMVLVSTLAQNAYSKPVEM